MAIISIVILLMSFTGMIFIIYLLMDFIESLGTALAMLTLWTFLLAAFVYSIKELIS